MCAYSLKIVPPGLVLLHNLCNVLVPLEVGLRPALASSSGLRWVSLAVISWLCVSGPTLSREPEVII